MSFTQIITRRISGFMKQCNFRRKGKCFYLIKSDIAFCVELDLPSGMLYVQAYVIPLYVPAENRYYTYGNRMNMMEDANLPVLKADASEDEIMAWCRSFEIAMRHVVLPFFEHVESPCVMLEWLESARCSVKNYFSCSALYLQRLRMFSYLYLQDQKKLQDAALAFRNETIQCDFLMSAVRQQFLTEVDTVLNFSKQEQIEYINRTVAEVSKRLF